MTNGFSDDVYRERKVHTALYYSPTEMHLQELSKEKRSNLQMKFSLGHAGRRHRSTAVEGGGLSVSLSGIKQHCTYTVIKRQSVFQQRGIHSSKN